MKDRLVLVVAGLLVLSGASQAFLFPAGWTPPPSSSSAAARPTSPAAAVARPLAVWSGLTPAAQVKQSPRPDALHNPSSPRTRNGLPDLSSPARPSTHFPYNSPTAPNSITSIPTPYWTKSTNPNSTRPRHPPTHRLTASNQIPIPALYPLTHPPNRPTAPNQMTPLHQTNQLPFQIPHAPPIPPHSLR